MVRPRGNGDIRGEGSIFSLKMGGVVGLMEKAEISETRLGGLGGG